MGNDPLFIVGASRSGTAMLRSIIGNHPDVYFPGETHYFDDLRPRMEGKEASGLSEDDQRVCEDYFLALTHRPYGHRGDPNQSKIAREELRAYAQKLGDGADHYFEAFCKMQAEREGRSIWGDKTPRHIFRIPEIITRYPEARIVCMVRDPRAVVASYRSWSNKGGFDFEADPGHVDALVEEEKRARASYHPILAAMLWRGGVQAAVTANERFGQARVYLQQYEQLVREPEQSARAICTWLGLDFSQAMLDIPLHNSSFSTFEKKGGVSTAPLGRWREQLGQNEIAVIQHITARTMRSAGYELEPISFSVGQAGYWLSLPVAVAKAFVANLDRMGGNPAAYLWRRAVLALRRGG